MRAPSEAYQRFAAEMEIRQVIHRYCRAVDRMDLDLLRACYHPEALDHHGDRERSVEEFLTWCWKRLERFDRTMHLVGNILVELDDASEDLALVETYAIAYHVTPGGDRRSNFEAAVRYVDRFERRASTGWRITYRACVTEWMRTIDPAQMWAIQDRLVMGQRSRDDPVYSRE